MTTTTALPAELVPPPDPPATSGREMIFVAGTVVVAMLVMQIVRGMAWQRANAFHFSDTRLWVTVAIEGAILLLWLPRLRRRGWTLRRLSVPYAHWDVARGIGLVLGARLAIWAVWVVVIMVARPFAMRVSAVQATGTVSWLALLGLAVLNPVFEETLYLGYLANALRRSSWAAALGASVALRVILHLYQGPPAFVFVLPLGLLFSIYYLRTGRLWPVVVAHIIMDVLPLGGLAHGLF
jgi:membrane protease YdiL (CAAX protease family)